MGKDLKNTKKNTEKENRVDFHKFTQFMSAIRKLMHVAKQDEESLNLSRMDDKFLKLLKKEGHTEIRSGVISRLKSERKFNKQKRKILSLNWLHVTLSFMILLVILSAGIGYNIWPDIQTELEKVDPLHTLAELESTPQILMKPSQITDSGYIAETSDFTFEIEGRLLGNPEKFIEISPEVDFSVDEVLAENGNSSITITPDKPLEKNTDYSIAILSGAKYSDGTEQIKDLEWSISVEPVFAILDTTPRNQLYGIPSNTAIEIDFNHRNISEESFSDFFKITPNVPGTFEKHGLKIVFVPNESLKRETKYHVEISGDFANQDGEKLGDNYEFTFTTDALDSEGDYIARELFWMGYDSRPLVSMSGAIALRAHTYEVDVETIKYTLYALTEEHMQEILHTGVGIADVPEDAYKILTQNIDLDTYFSYIPEGSGTYLVTAQARGDTLYRVVNYSKLGILSSSIREEFEGWVFDMTTSLPAQGAEIEVYADGELQDVTQVDNNGYYKLKSGDYLIARIGDDSTIWYSGLNTTTVTNDWYSWNWGGGVFNRRETAHLALDKPYYAKGDVVNVFGVIRELVGTDLEPTGLSEVTIRVDDSYYDSVNPLQVPIYENTYDVDAKFGTFSASFTIPQNLDNGGKIITVLSQGEEIGRTSFDVSEIAKPQEIYSLSLDKGRYVFGESMVASVSGVDYSGNPLSGKKVRIEVTSSELDSNMIQSGYYESFGFWSSSSEVAEKTLVLDENGVAVFNYTPVAKSDESNFHSYGFLVLPDDEEYQFLATSTVGFAELDYDVEVRTDIDGFLKVGDDIDLMFKSVEIWDRDTKADVAFDLEIERVWGELKEDGTRYDDRTKRTYKTYEYITHREDVLPEAVSLVTNTTGDVKYDLSNLEEGSYNLMMRYGDTSEEHSNVFYVSNRTAEDVDYYREFVEMDISTSSAAVGDVVEVSLISNEDVGGVYYVVGSEVFDTKIISLGVGDSFENSILLTEEMFPEVTVCFNGIVNGGSSDSWVGSCRSINVDSDLHTIDVEITTDKDEYEPGDEVKLTISTADSTGKPVVARVNVNALDKAFADSAQYSTMQTKEYRNYFYDRIKSAKTFQINGEKFSNAGGIGAGGGGDEPRTDFRDNAYWSTEIVTDANGKATVSFVLPDNLTTWMLEVRAVDDTDSFGTAQSQVVTNLTRYVAIETPNFLRIGDSTSLEIIVGNYEKAFDGVLKLSCTGCTEKEWEKDFSSEENSVKSFKVPITVGSKEELITVVSEILDSADQVIDSVSYKIPIYGNSVIGHTVLSDVILSSEKKSTYEFEIDGDRLDQAMVEVSLSRALNLDEFQYPADITITSTKNLTNSILHNTFILEHYDDLKPKVSVSSLKEDIQYKQDLLRGYQSDDGGFGWFDYDAVDLNSSLRVAHALRVVDESSMDINTGVKRNLVDYFVPIVENMNNKYSIHDMLDAYNGIAILDARTAALYSNDIRTAFMASDEAKSSALTIARLIDSNNALRNTGDNLWLLSLLKKAAITEGSSIHWEMSLESYSEDYTAQYVTSEVYKALQPLEAWELKYASRTWLMNEIGTGFSYSEDYLSVLYAIAIGDEDSLIFDYNVMNVNVLLNGKVVENVVFKDNDPYQDAVMRSDSALLAEGLNTVEIKRSTSSELYVNIMIDSFDQATTTNDNFEITRVLRDLNGKELKGDIEENQILKVSVSVVPVGDYNNVVVRDFLPAGLSPVRFDLAGVNPLTVTKFFQYIPGSSITNRWGSINKDYVSFTSASMEKGKTYEFEYAVLADDIGQYDGGGTHVYSSRIDGINSFLQSSRINIK